jgi:excisionase family DNA binding protein
VDVMLFTIDEAATRLRVSRWSVYNLIRSGELHTINIGRRRLVPSDALSDCLDHLKELAA